ncbi:MAG: DUF748 domain-containing protein [Xanthomonadales bacterium]|nr:DUF748 domain-containing protein [Xanthomonadales bacterium]
MHASVRRIIAISFGVAILYTLAGFLLAPYLLKRQITGVLSEYSGGEVTVGRLSVNPFLFSAELAQLSIDTPDRLPLFTLLSAQARFDISSLWGRGWNIRELVLDTPRLWVNTLPDIFDGSDSVPFVAIGRLQVKRGQLQWTDTAATAAVPNSKIDLTGMEITLENLGADPLKPHQYTLAAVVNRSGWLKSTGSLNPSPVRLDAMVEFSGFNLAGLDSLMPAAGDPGQQLKILSALLSGKLNVRYEHRQTTIRGQAGLDQFELVERSNHAAVFSAAKVKAMELSIQSSPFTASVGVLQLNKPHLRLELDADGTLRGGHWLRPLLDGPGSRTSTTPRIEIQAGLLDLTDQGLAPPFRLETDRVEGSIVRHDGGIMASIEGRVMGGSTSALNAHWLPTDANGHGSLDISVGNLDATVLSPYLAALAGRGIASGQLDLSFDYLATDQQYDLNNEISVQGFQLDEATASPVARELPLELAVALVRDENDRIKISIPVPPGRLDENLHPGSLVSRGFGNLVQSITKSPFHTLGELAGVSSQHLEQVVFIPGAAALSESAARKLDILATALVQRPGLGLKVNGRFDEVADRQALARKQVGLHVALATSAGPPGRDVPGAIDFDDSKVISVLNEFAGERLSEVQLTALQVQHPQQGSAYYAAVFEVLVENEAVSRTALKSLARYRARTIADQLAASGVDPARLQIGSETETARAHARVVIVELQIALL